MWTRSTAAVLTSTKAHTESERMWIIHVTEYLEGSRGRWRMGLHHGKTHNFKLNVRTIFCFLNLFWPFQRHGIVTVHPTACQGSHWLLFCFSPFSQSFCPCLDFFTLAYDNPVLSIPDFQKWPEARFTHPNPSYQTKSLLPWGQMPHTILCSSQPSETAGLAGWYPVSAEPTSHT